MFRSHNASQKAGRISFRAAPAAAATATLILAAGCASPIQQRTEAELRRAVSDAMEREIAEAERYAAEISTSRESRVGELEIRQDSLDEIRENYDPRRYFLTEDERGRDDAALTQIDELLGEDLYGRPQRVVTLGLRRAVTTAVAQNLNVQSARLTPAINEAAVATAEAIFDWTFFASTQWQDEDTPQAGPGFLNLGSTVNAQQTVFGETGLRKQLVTGGQFEISQDFLYTDLRQSGFGVLPSPNPSAATGLNLSLDQPLLRGFGTEVALSEIRIARNAERRGIATLKASVISALTETERAYWDLVRAHRELVITARLLQRGETVREEIKARREFDAVQAQVADAVATVESRRGDVLRARTNLRRTSDRLKRLMNDPQLPVGSEVLLIPVDEALDQPVSFSLVDSVQQALDLRPELDEAVLAIDDASIRQTVADNARLPQLDLRAEASLLGFDENTGESLGNQYDGEFIDNFLLGLFFEQPIGNRAAEAELRRRRLERLQSVVEYRRTVQDIVLEVKEALDNVVLNYELIEQARTSRIAAAEALRTLLVEKELTQRGFTVERLDLEFGQQDALAAAERQEIQALIDYNIAIADLHDAMGTTLRRNRIDFVVPDANQVLEGRSALDYKIDELSDAPADAPAETEAGNAD